MTEADYNMTVALVGLTGVLLYTAILLIGYIKAMERAQEEAETEENIRILVKDIFDELKNTIERGEDSMTEAKVDHKGEVHIKTEGAIYMPLVKPEIKNHMSLTDLVTNKAEDRHYDVVVELLTSLARKTYQDYKFFIAKSEDETKDYNFLQVVSKYEDDPYTHKLIFSKGVEHGLDSAELSRRFAEYAKEGNVLRLGGEVVILTEDGTGQSPTGVSPISNGLEGSEIAFIFGFIQKKNYDEWYKNTFPQKDEE
ncbi:putative membrane protein [Bacillus phage PK16]|nr:putative membrane protein [Bacillus phage PK16]